MRRQCFFLLIFIFLIACTKETDLPIIRYEIKIGDYSNMVVTYFDKILPDSSNYLELDVNNDLIPDFKIGSGIWGSNALGHHPKSEFLCINNESSVFGYITNDTSFLVQTSTIQEYNNHLSLFKYYHYSYERTSNKDSVIRITMNQFHLKALNKNELLNKAGVFSSDTILLTLERYNTPPWMVSNYNADTLVYQIASFNSNPNSFPQNQIKYIGVKITRDGEQKIGWIKLSIFDYNRIVIFESAIEE